MIQQQYTVAIWAGFDQFKEIAEYYMSVHDPFIINGINLVNKMAFQTTLLPGVRRSRHTLKQVKMQLQV